MSMANELEVKKYQSVIDASGATIKYAFLLNGATALALLAFMSNFVAEKPEIATRFADSFWTLGAGALFAAFSAFFAYGTNYCFFVEKWNTGKVYFWLMLGAKILSFILFTYSLVCIGFVFSTL